MNYKKLAEEIVKEVGGIENIGYMTNCATRLRVTIKDDSKVDLTKIKQIDGVIGAVKKGGQYQIIIGTDVVHVRNEVSKMGDINSDNIEKQDGKVLKKKSVDKIMDLFSGIFTPIIPAITAAGMLKAILILLTLCNVISKESQTYYILNFMSDSAFYFLPVLVGFSAANKLKCNPYLAVAIAGVLVHPDMIKLKTAGEAVSFWGLPVPLVSYSYSVIPIILATVLMAYVEPFADKISPKPIKFFSKPLITFFIVAPITLVVLGPMGSFIGDKMAIFSDWLNTTIPWLLPTIMGAFMPLLVLTGMHWSFAPVIFQSYATFGSEAIMGPGSFVSNICQGAAALAVSIKTKNKDLKQMAGSAGVTALLGITEPALFGITLKQKTILASVMIGGAVGGLYAGINGVVRYTSGTPGLASFAVFIGENPMNVVHALISVAIGFVVTFILTYFKGFKEIAETKEGTENSSNNILNKVVVTSPADGETVYLSEINDEVISEGILGKGIAVKPLNGKVVSPIDGRVTSVFPTKHAIGLIDKNGIEILIHIGIDTVKLEGKYFKSHIKEGDEVQKGDLLITFDKDKIEEEGFETVTMVIVSNYSEFLDVLSYGDKNVKVLDEIMTVVL